MASPEQCSRKLTSMGEVLQPQSRPSPGSHRSSAVPTQAQLAKEEVVENQNARMRQHWDKAACKELGTSDRYQNVAVLIVRWVQELDQDLKCWQEVEELDQLFRTDFGYECKVVALDNKRKRPQAQFNSEMSTFVLEHDGHFRNNLLIVYYSGHGYLKEIDGVDELFIAGTQEPQSADAEGLTYPAEVRWDKGEAALEDTEADVLTIMDCCFASNIMKGVTDQTRTYETLAATGHNLTTPKPGKRSYTRALIDSLKEELNRFEMNERRPFDTFKLNQRIKQRQNWSHQPQLFHRNHCAKSRHIRLAPLEKTAAPPTQQDLTCSGTLNLQLTFSKKSNLHGPEIAKLATKLAKAARKSDLGITALDWIGFTPNVRTTQFRRLLRLIFMLKIAMARFGLKRRKGQKRQVEDDFQDLPPAKREHLEISVQGPEDCSASPAPLTPSASSNAGTEDL